MNLNSSFIFLLIVGWVLIAGCSSVQQTTLPSHEMITTQVTTALPTSTNTPQNCQICGGKSYCDIEGECCNGKWYAKCPLGYYLGDDCGCHAIRLPTTIATTATPSKYITITPDITKSPPCDEFWHYCSLDNKCYPPCPAGTKWAFSKDSEVCRCMDTMCRYAYMENGKWYCWQ